MKPLKLPLHVTRPIFLFVQHRPRRGEMRRTREGHLLAPMQLVPPEELADCPFIYTHVILTLPLKTGRALYREHKQLAENRWLLCPLHVFSVSSETSRRFTSRSRTNGIGRKVRSKGGNRSENAALPQTSLTSFHSEIFTSESLTPLNRSDARLCSVRVPSSLKSANAKRVRR